MIWFRKTIFDDGFDRGWTAVGVQFENTTHCGRGLPGSQVQYNNLAKLKNTQQLKNCVLV